MCVKSYCLTGKHTPGKGTGSQVDINERQRKRHAINHEVVFFFFFYVPNGVPLDFVTIIKYYCNL